MEDKGTKIISLHEGVVDELIEKKSRFIVSVIPVTTIETAAEELEKLRKKYYDARHNCFAYVIGDDGSELRCSDDGEPSGTAGKPMLDVILGSDIKNILVVVTRYFGGTLLGTGGLVRAYTQATQLGLEGCTLIEKKLGRSLEIRTDYNGVGKVQYILGEHRIQIIESDYSDVVRISAMVPSHLITFISELIIEGTHGKVELNVGKENWYAIVDDTLKIFTN